MPFRGADGCRGVVAIKRHRLQRRHVNHGLPVEKSGPINHSASGASLLSDRHFLKALRKDARVWLQADLFTDRNEVSDLFLQRGAELSQSKSGQGARTTCNKCTMRLRLFPEGCFDPVGMFQQGRPVTIFKLNV